MLYLNPSAVEYDFLDRCPQPVFLLFFAMRPWTQWNASGILGNLTSGRLNSLRTYTSHLVSLWITLE